MSTTLSVLRKVKIESLQGQRAFVNTRRNLEHYHSLYIHIYRTLQSWCSSILKHHPITQLLNMSHAELPEPGFIARGELIGTGLTGIVELSNGYAVKTPWPGKEGSQSQDDIRLEWRAYERIGQRLGNHIRFVKIIAFDRKQLTLTMKYMVNGTLRQHLQANGQYITAHQRRLWTQAMAEGLHLIHELDIIHCDLTPHNMFLDDNLELKIADFGCCSIDGSESVAATDVRFYPPRPFYKSPVSTDDDLFALGSCIYETVTGTAPFKDILSPQVRVLAGLRQFPDLTGLDCMDIIRDCWLGRAHSAKHVLRRLLQL